MTISADMVRQIVAEMRMPALSVYGGDWLRDAVSGCSLPAQGLWFRLMLIMHDAKPYGHLVGSNGEPLGEKQLLRQIGCSSSQLRTLRAELEGVGIPGRTGDASYAPIFIGDINGEEIDLSPLRIDLDGVIYSRRMVKDQRLRVIRRLVAIFGRPKSGRMTGQNADTRARGRADNETEVSSPPTTDPVRVLTPQQAAVKSVEDALEEHTHGFALPQPARIAKWITKFGVDPILATILAEGDAGTLDGKNANYLHQILENRKRSPHERTGKRTAIRSIDADQPTARELGMRTADDVLKSIAAKR